jgi:aspartyl aminopeptidase
VVAGASNDPHVPGPVARGRAFGRVLEQAIDALPEPCRTVFVLRAVEELSAAETAACLEIPEAIVATRLRRARARLRAALLARATAAAPEGVRVPRAAVRPRRGRGAASPRRRGLLLCRRRGLSAPRRSRAGTNRVTLGRAMPHDLDAARDLCAYLDASPSPYHAVAETARRLEARGFARLEETADWALRPGDARYVTRGDSSIVAFRVGEQSPVEAGFRLVAAPHDSPNLRLKPQCVAGREGYAQLAVEVYGGVLLHTCSTATWASRAAAGRAARRLAGPSSARLDAPVARVPTWRSTWTVRSTTAGWCSTAQHLAPVFALGEPDARASGSSPRSRPRRHRRRARARVRPGAVRPDRGEGGGARRGVRVRRAAGQPGLVPRGHDGAADAGAPRGAHARDRLFDHEEVGSGSATGAAGTFLRDVLGRVIEAAADGPAPRGGLARAAAASYCVSADMAHAVHPNFADKHERGTCPGPGAGR